MLPISLGGLLGDGILHHGTYALLFVVAGILALASLVLSLPLRDRAPAADGLPNRGFFAAMRQSDLLPVWFIGTMFALALSSYFTFLKTFVMLSATGSVGGFFTAYAGAAIVLRLFFAWLPDRIGPKRVLFPALLVLAGGLLRLSLAQSSFDVLSAGGLCGLGHGFVFPILSGIVVSRTRPAERGAALSIYTALFDAGVLLGGPLFGTVIRLADYPAMFATAAATIAAGTAVFAVWDAYASRRRT